MLTVTGFLKGFADFAIVFLTEFIAFLGFGDLNPNNNMVTNTLQFHNISRASRVVRLCLPYTLVLVPK